MTSPRPKPPEIRVPLHGWIGRAPPWWARTVNRFTLPVDGRSNHLHMEGPERGLVRAARSSAEEQAGVLSVIGVGKPRQLTLTTLSFLFSGRAS